ncbi:hypothetical protein ACLOJK_033039 [Asimina triloba]
MEQHVLQLSVAPQRRAQRHRKLVTRRASQARHPPQSGFFMTRNIRALVGAKPNFVILILEFICGLHRQRQFSPKLSLRAAAAPWGACPDLGVRHRFTGCLGEDGHGREETLLLTSHGFFIAAADVNKGSDAAGIQRRGNGKGEAGEGGGGTCCGAVAVDVDVGSPMLSSTIRKEIGAGRWDSKKGKGKRGKGKPEREEETLLRKKGKGETGKGGGKEIGAGEGKGKGQAARKETRRGKAGKGRPAMAGRDREQGRGRHARERRKGRGASGL